MDIKLRPELLSLIRELSTISDNQADLERLANDLLFLYIQGDLIRPSEIAGRFSIPNVYRKDTAHFDAQTHAFAGVVVGESLWVPGIELRDMLERNTEVVVLASPRKTGIRRKKGKAQTVKKQ